MKKLFLFLILTFSSLTIKCYSQQYGWLNITTNLPDFPYDTLYNVYGDTIVAGLMDLSFINDNEGWIVTANGNGQGGGAVLHTTDGGETWEAFGVNTVCLAIQMLNENTGYAGGMGGIIWKTTDGGETWAFHGTIGNTLVDIEFPPQPADTGYACGMNGSFCMITPSGIVLIPSGIVGHVETLSFPVTKDEGWFEGEGWGMIRHFINGQWTPDQIHISGYYNSIDFADNQNGWVVGDRILHTSDGYEWIEQTNHPLLEGSLFDVCFINSNEGWTVGTTGQVLKTSNGGELWLNEEVGTDEFLEAVQFTSPTNGFIIGANKAIYKYTQLTSVEEETKLPTKFGLEQNYPNPFNPSTKISWQSPVSSWQTLKVYDVLGNEVATLVNEEKPAGSYEVELNPSSSLQHLASGVYFYRAKSR